MPFKHNASRRHHIGKMKFKVTNWPEYEAGLRRRGSLTLWVTREALSSWQAPKRTTRGGQPRYSDLAIKTALTLGLVFGLRLRQTEKLFLGCTTMELGAHFAERTGLSRRFVHVMRWIDDPAAATDDAKLVAILSLARDLCRHNQVGASGDPAHANFVPIEQTDEWRILRESIYPSFNLQKFEKQIHAQCARLRTEFSGRQTGTVGELVSGGTA